MRADAIRRLLFFKFKKEADGNYKTMTSNKRTEHPGTKKESAFIKAEKKDWRCRHEIERKQHDPPPNKP